MKHIFSLWISLQASKRSVCMIIPNIDSYLWLAVVKLIERASFLGHNNMYDIPLGHADELWTPLNAINTKMLCE